MIFGFLKRAARDQQWWSTNSHLFTYLVFRMYMISTVVIVEVGERETLQIQDDQADDKHSLD